MLFVYYIIYIYIYEYVYNVTVCSLFTRHRVRTILILKYRLLNINTRYKFPSQTNPHKIIIDNSSNQKKLTPPVNNKSINNYNYHIR